MLQKLEETTTTTKRLPMRARQEKVIENRALKDEDGGLGVAAEGAQTHCRRGRPQYKEVACNLVILEVERGLR